jgi:hypothetical protein
MTAIRTPTADPTRTADPTVDPDEAALLEESQRIFRNLVRGVFALIAVLFGIMVWVLGQPDTYHEHLAEQPPGATAPDGSVETPSAQPGG